jgi:hypothetical protein
VFDFTHNFLWQGTFAIVVFVVWLIWVERSFLTMPRLRFLGIFLLSSAISVFALGLIIKPYLRVLAEVSDKLMLLTWPLSLSDKLLLLTQTSGISIIAVGNEILYRGKPLQVIYLFHSVNVFDSAVFIGLMTASMVCATLSLSKGIKRILAGMVVLIILHLIFIYGSGLLFSKGVLKDNILEVMKGASIITPVLLWFFLKKGAYNEKVISAT